MTWHRTHDSKLSLGVSNLITLSMRNRSKREAVFQMRDATPPLLVPRGNRRDGRCGPGEDWSIQYRVWPLHRGEYRLGPVTARFRGPLGLAFRQRKWELAEDVKVYPNLLAVRSYETLVRRGQLEEIGVKSARRFGTGTEFEQLRDYTSDDGFRAINWKATARTGHLISTDYRTERSQNVLLVLDAGRVMSTPIPLKMGFEFEAGRAPAALTRFDYAVNAALLLSFVAQQSGDRVGLLAFGEGISRYLPPKPGRTGFSQIVEGLHALEPQPVEPDYRLGLGYLTRRQGPRSLVILFTDIMESDASGMMTSALLQLARRHLCLTVTLRDPDLEGMAKTIPNNSTEVYRRAVATMVMADRQKALQTLRDRGVLTLDVGADAVSAEAVNRYLEVKARRLL